MQDTQDHLPDAIKNINDKLENLDLALQELLETTYKVFPVDEYLGIESAFILDHALNIKMHFYRKYPEFTPPHLKGGENTYHRIIHFREGYPEDRVVQVDPYQQK